MKKLFCIAVAVFTVHVAAAQTCTMTASGTFNWPSTNGTGVSCAEGGTANGQSILIIPAGVTVVFDNNNDSWSGGRIEVFGTLRVTASPTLLTSVEVKSGGLLDLQGKLSLGTTAGCPYTLSVASGGTVTVGGTGSDRLAICGEDIMKGNGDCNDCGGTNSGQCPSDGRPYCQPSGGFTGPTGYDEDGFDSTLPVKLLSFKVQSIGSEVNLDWSTVMEENFYKFVIQRSADGRTFADIGEVPGQGFDIHDIVSTYAFSDKAPLLGLSYYRLKAVDLDGSYEYFTVKAVSIQGEKSLVVYPNPSNGQLISFRTNFDSDELDRISLIDPLGIQIFNGRANDAQNGIAFSEKLRPGVYMLRYTAGDFDQIARVIVRN